VATGIARRPLSFAQNTCMASSESRS
jgi:hypothetical protein